MLQRRVNGHCPALASELGRDARKALETFDELRAAIWIARIIERIYTDEQIL